MSSSMAGSSLRLVTRSAIAVPSEPEVRLRPSHSRRHQLCFGLSSIAVAHCGGVLAVSNSKAESLRTYYMRYAPAKQRRTNPGPPALLRRPDARDRQAGGAAGASQTKGGENLEASFEAVRFGLPRPPKLAHRLDRDASGCLALGRHGKALARSASSSSTAKCKTYWALVEGGPTEDEGTIDLPLGRLNHPRSWSMKADPDGLPAVTRWESAAAAARPAPHPSGSRWSR